MFDELARVKVGAAVAFVVDALRVKHQRATLTVEFRQAVEGQHVGNHAGHHLGNGRAARHLDDRLVEDDLVNRRGAGRVGRGGLHAAVGGAGAPANDRLGMFGGHLELFDKGFAADNAIHAVFVQWRVAFDGEDVVALVFLDRIHQGSFGLMARGGHQSVVVVKADHRQDDILGQRMRRADEAFAAAGAFEAVDPDYRGARLCLHRLGDFWDKGGAEAKCRRGE
ncbi:hypothetical protein GALL_544550 [mine drainage metagenome]|uniref:Uncharacterized protein n=1 Tax=mine drainage metagenome TaxID=410659 RepID=A0A1J5NYW8_9ZZZZ